MTYMGDEAWWNNRFQNRSDYLLSPDTCLEADLWQLPKQGKVLDLACGDGRNALFLARQGYHVTAVDFCEEALKRLERFASREKLQVTTIKMDFARDQKIIQILEMRI